MEDGESSKDSRLQPSQYLPPKSRPVSSEDDGQTGAAAFFSE